MKSLSLIFILLLSSRVFATDPPKFKDCGINMGSKAGRTECASLNPDAGTPAWRLVRHMGERSWWIDTENEIVWGPTHSVKAGSQPEDGVVAFTFDRAAGICSREGGTLPRPDDYVAAFTYLGGATVMKSSTESALGPSPVFWAQSEYLKDKAWWITFNQTNQLASPNAVTPTSKMLGADFRCIWRR